MANIETVSQSIMRAFEAYLQNDPKLNDLVYQMRKSTDYELANEYAVRVGEVLHNSMARYFRYYGIDTLTEADADTILRPLLTLDHGVISAVVETIQSNKNAALGVGLLPQLPELDANRINGLIAEVSKFENVADEVGKVKEQVINFTQSIVDDGIRKNATIQGKAGFKTYIVRKPEAADVKSIVHIVRSKKGKEYKYHYSYSVPCRWCAALAGTYEYTGNGSNIPKDVYRRHDACRCTLTYVNGNMRQNVWNHPETWTEADATQQTEIVEQAIEAKKTTPLKQRRDQAALTLRNDIGFENVSDTLIKKVDVDLLESITTQLTSLENRFNIIHRSNETSFNYVGRHKAIAFVTSRGYNSGNQWLTINGQYFRSLDGMMRETFDMVKQGWSMPIDLRNDFELQTYSITHEYGHMIHNLLFNQYQLANPGSSITRGEWVANVQNELIKIATNNNPQFKLIDNISQYGRKNQFEFFAEVFANSQYSKPNELGRAMQEWLKQKGY